MSIGWGAGSNLPVAGSQAVGSPLWPQVKTRPSGSTCEWMETTGHFITLPQAPSREPTTGEGGG